MAEAKAWGQESREGDRPGPGRECRGDPTPHAGIWSWPTGQECVWQRPPLRATATLNNSAQPLWPTSPRRLLLLFPLIVSLMTLWGQVPIVLWAWGSLPGFLPWGVVNVFPSPAFLWPTYLVPAARQLPPPTPCAGMGLPGSPQSLLDMLGSIYMQVSIHFSFISKNCLSGSLPRLLSPVLFMCTG